MRIFIMLMVSLSLISVGSASAKTPGNVTMKVVTSPKGPAGKGGNEVRAEAVVLRTGMSEQLKAIGLNLLDQLKNSYPDCRSYTISISDDARMLKIGNFLAVVTSKEGKVIVTGGIPTNMDIRVMKASHVEVRKPDELRMQVAYDVAMQKKGKLFAGKTVYSQVAEKHKLTAPMVHQIERETTQYYKAFEGKPF
jgi:hypothetical protein